MVEENYYQITEEVITAHCILTTLIASEFFFWRKLPKISQNRLKGTRKDHFEYDVHVKLLLMMKAKTIAKGK